MYSGFANQKFKPHQLEYLQHFRDHVLMVSMLGIIISSWWITGTDVLYRDIICSTSAK
jgi:hypothetical protein